MGKINITINGENLAVEEGITVLEAAEEAGVNIPTLCFLKDCNAVGACRVCLSDIDGKMMQSCIVRAKDGMVISTDTPEVEAARKAALEKLCENHRFECDFCRRYSDCEFYKMLIHYDVREDEVLFGKPMRDDETVEDNAYIVRDNSKCINCRRCVGVCSNIQNMGILKFRNGAVGPETSLDEAGCVHCGQCVAVCPTGALSEKKETRWVWNAISNEDVYTVAVLAPYSAAAFAESIYFSPDADDKRRLAAALRKMGFNAVFDGGFAIRDAQKKREEKLSKGEKTVSGICPSVKRLCALKYPDILNDETGIFDDFAGRCRSIAEADAAGKKIYVAVIVPCIAEKEEQYTGNADAFITTNELVSMWNRACVSRFTARDLWKKMKPGEFDPVDGQQEYKGINAHGGIMESAVRSVDPKAVFIGSDGIIIAEYTVCGKVHRAAFTSGLKEGQKLLDMTDEFDAVEVMACHGGCICGGGQPRLAGPDFTCSCPEERFVVI